MEYLWLIYWGWVLFSFIFGIIVAIKKNKIMGILEVILSLIMPIWAFIFALKRNYLINGYIENEFIFLYNEIINGNIEGILIVLLFLLLIVVSVYNIFYFKKNN